MAAVRPYYWGTTFHTRYLALRSENASSTNGDNSGCYGNLFYDYFMGDNSLAFLGLTILALFLLILCGLLSGLTLAVCSLDATYLQILSTSGNDEERLMFLTFSGSGLKLTILMYTGTRQ